MFAVAPGFATGLLALFALYEAVVILKAKTTGLILKSVAVVMVLVAAWLLLRRDTYLTFLSATAFPPSLLKETAPAGANLEVSVAAPPGARVVYWAADAGPADAVAPTPQAGYGDYENAGVAVAGPDGKAILKFKCPVQYKVGLKTSPLKRHLHYRVCCEGKSLLGRVQTVWVTC